MDSVNVMDDVDYDSDTSGETSDAEPIVNDLGQGREHCQLDFWLW